MLRAIIISLAALGIVYASAGIGRNTTSTEQKESAEKVEKKPRMGYEDPYFPPAKGHGF
ncbi:hypothetical protein GA0061102_105421 [Rhizobium miluonense]|uniref:Uncharacterized protein n=1 Tax=Rhizobium miluonense TaxID=411945 RepID=A0A1C3X341_9HYPH|nr:hypothetical protein GA0061102_105421 [Rhizobium miluonense]